MIQPRDRKISGRYLDKFMGISCFVHLVSGWFVINRIIIDSISFMDINSFLMKCFKHYGNI